MDDRASYIISTLNISILEIKKKNILSKFLIQNYNFPDKDGKNYNINNPDEQPTLSMLDLGLAWAELTNVILKFGLKGCVGWYLRKKVKRGHTNLKLASDASEADSGLRGLGWPLRP